ncbi:MAG: hypothetical protein WD770_09595 [Actinomycetota bacterium]
MSVYLVHGFRFDSEIPLEVPAGEGPADYEVRWGEAEPAGAGPPPGELLAELNEDGVAYSVARDGETLRMRLAGLVEFRIGPDAISVHMDPAADPEMASVLLSGSVPALLHTAAGTGVLHASAVAFDDGAIVLVGGAGAGKSTLSAVCCAAGGRLVTEDLLRLRMDPQGPVALPGVPEIRLRPQAEALADAFPPEVRGSTPDGRTRLRFPSPEEAAVRVVVLPVPSREVDRLEADRLRPAEALVELGRYPRVLGWKTPEVRMARFRMLAGLVRAVPVVRARIPWGPPFDPALADRLRALATG